MDVEAEDLEEMTGCSATSGTGLKGETSREIHSFIQRWKETTYGDNAPFEQLRGGSDRDELTGSASLDHRLMPDIVNQDETESGGAGGNLFDNLSAKVKPGKRKGSLDDIVGKLSASVFQMRGGQNSVGSSESDEMGGSSAFETGDDYDVGGSLPKRIRLDDDSLDEMPSRT